MKSFAYLQSFTDVIGIRLASKIIPVPVCCFPQNKTILISLGVIRLTMNPVRIIKPSICVRPDPFTFYEIICTANPKITFLQKKKRKYK